VLLCAVVGAAVTTPIGLTALVALSAGAALLAVRWQTRAPMAVVAVLVVWAGYTLFTHDFADLHVSVGSLPVYIGELLLLVAVPWALVRVDVRALNKNVYFVALAAWMVFCAARLLMGGLDYGIDALRDSAIWYYGLFSVVGYVVWGSLRQHAWTRYFTVLFVVLVVVTSAILLAGTLNLPWRIPREDILAASLIAAANFFLLALRTARFYVLRLLVSSAALALLVPLEVRSATVGVVILLGVFALQRRWNTMLSLVAIPIVVLGVVALADIQLPGRVGGGSSAAELVSRQLSVVPLLFQGKVTGSDPNLPHDATYGTAVWRYNWWVALVNDTLSKPETTFFGVGFGADITGPLEVDQSGLDRPLRSPHNIAINMFARTGLIGLALWLVVQGSWLYVTLRAIGAGIRAGRASDVDYLLWICTYAVTILVVALLGVVLESPFGAIPYFLLIGMAMRKAHEFETVAVPGVARVPIARPFGAMRGQPVA
jgi:hypothetical protein